MCVTICYITYMTYDVRYEKAAIKSLAKLQPKVRKRVMDKVAELAKDPYRPNQNAKKLQGAEGYRLRVGDLRVFYHLHDDALVVLVLDVKPRGGAYQ